MYKFSKNLETTSKFWASFRWYEASTEELQVLSSTIKKNYPPWWPLVRIHAPWHIKICDGVCLIILLNYDSRIWLWMEKSLKIISSFIFTFFICTRIEEGNFVCSYNSQVVQPLCFKRLELGLCFLLRPTANTKRRICLIDIYWNQNIWLRAKLDSGCPGLQIDQSARQFTYL